MPQPSPIHTLLLSLNGDSENQWYPGYIWQEWYNDVLAPRSPTTIYNCSFALTTRVFHVVSASAALQITPEYSLQAFLSCANDLMYLKSSFLLKVDIGKSLLIDFDLLMSLFSVVTILSLGLPLNFFSDSSK